MIIIKILRDYFDYWDPRSPSAIDMHCSCRYCYSHMLHQLRGPALHAPMLVTCPLSSCMLHSSSYHIHAPHSAAHSPASTKLIHGCCSTSASIHCWLLQQLTFIAGVPSTIFLAMSEVMSQATGATEEFNC